MTSEPEKRIWLRSPQAAATAAGAVLLAILALYFASHWVPHGEEPASGPLTEIAGDLDLSSLDGLPEGLQEGAVKILTAQIPEPPAVLEGIPVSNGDRLITPVLETIADTQPTVRWMPFGTSYGITLLDGNSMVIFRAEGIQGTEWKVPRILNRGGVYTWTVTSAGQMESASFQVLDSGGMNQWSSARFAGAKSHLVLGIAAQQLGMMSVAEKEFEALAAENPNSDLAARLLQNIQQLRGR